MRRQLRWALRGIDRVGHAMSRARMLAEASAALVVSLDYESTIASALRVTLPTLGDWAEAHLARVGGSFVRIGPVVGDMALAPVADAVRAAGAVTDWRSDEDVCRVRLVKGETVLVNDLSSAWFDEHVTVGDYTRLVLSFRPTALMLVPLVARGKTLGSLLFLTCDGARRYSDDDVALAEDVGRRVASAVDNGRLYHALEKASHAAEAARSRAEFLADTTAVLASSLDYEVTLRALARRAVPRLADICAVDVTEGRSGVRRVAVAHGDPRREAAILEHRARHGYSPIGPIAHALRTGQAELMPDVSDEDLRRMAVNAEQLEFFRSLGLRSAMFVPLRRSAEVFGVLTFLAVSPRPPYEEEDLRFAIDVAQRAAVAIENARLYTDVARARADAEAANHAKDELLAVLSHELRTPLTAMLGWVRLLRRDAVPMERRAAALETIERNAQLQAKLIEDLLDVSRIVLGKLVIDPWPVDFGAVVVAGVEGIREEASAKRLTVRVGADTDVTVAGEEQRLQQIVGNLLANAVKFTPEGGEIDVGLTREGSRAHLVVRDTGEGIAAHLLPHIFDRFRQGSTGTARMHGGLGLGLALVRHLVEAHGGTVRAASEGEGKGACFTVDLPLAAEPTPARRPAPSSDAMIRTLQGRRILVVDDDADGRNLIEAVLAGAGATVSVAASAAEALQLVADAWSELILTDLAMPVDDGYQLLAEVRGLDRHHGRRRTVVLALTAYADEDTQRRVARAGFDGYLAKPIDPARLIARVGAVFTATTP
jgi:signal transduction histidine kinase/CheY-like chemotaxis protein